jgi:G3E family GTPase
MPATPVSVIGGYLGAGKTTLVNALLRGAGGQRLAVLVNDFGELPIDADLIDAREGNLISIAGGCVCCSFGSDLMAAILELKSSPRPIDHLLIETSGVALPASIAQSLQLLPDLLLNGIVVLADAETVEARASDRYVGDTVTAQLVAADLVLLNKIDLVSPDDLARTRDWLAGVARRARVVPVEKAAVPPELILGARETPRTSPFMASGHDSALYSGLSFEIDGSGDAAALAQVLAGPALHLLRAKGIVFDRERGLTALNVVGARWSAVPAPSAAQGPGRLVCIGITDRISRDAIVAAIASCPSFLARP